MTVFLSVWAFCSKLSIDLFKVIPFLPRPLLLTDFLLTSYSVGGAISLLALSSVYTLISQHNLEFPQFYTKLYQLFAPEVMHVKYRPRFFHLSSLFLSSTHLPEYLVAAFVKRLARLCLTAPAHCIPMALRFANITPKLGCNENFVPGLSTI